MIVVFDSNVWLAELGLRSGAAAAAKFFLNHSGSRLALPEVVRLEVQQNLEARLTEHIGHIQTSYRQLLTAFGTLREVVLPTPDEVREKVNELFDSVQVPKVDVPFSLTSARSSFLKAIAKVPPSDKTQEFKDGVLWADCVALLAHEPVALVTADKAFYQERSYEKGLATNLKDEVAACPHPLQLHPNLSSLLHAIRQPVALDEALLAAAFLAAHRESVYGTLDRQGFELGHRTSVEYILFATENPEVLFLEFSMSFACNDIRGEGRTDSVLLLKGDASYIPATGAFTDIRNFGEHLKFRLPDGSEGETRNAVLYAAGIVIGHRQVSNVVRYRLGDEP